MEEADIGRYAWGELTWQQDEIDPKKINLNMLFTIKDIAESLVGIGSREEITT